MAGQVEAERFALEGEQLALGPGGRLRQLLALPLARGDRLERSEERALAARAFVLDPLRPVHRRVDAGDEARPELAERVEASGLDERLEGPLVHLVAVDLDAEIAERVESAGAPTGVENREDGPLADVLDGREPEPDLVPLDREVEPADVDVGREDGDPHLAALADVLDELVGVPLFRRQKSRHEVDGKVDLEVRG